MLHIFFTGHAEVTSIMTPDQSLFVLLRLADGDRESMRTKFVLITFVGSEVGGLARARVGTHMSSIKPLLGVCDVISCCSILQFDWSIVLCVSAMQL
jgi:hypothetical protein